MPLFVFLISRSDWLIFACAYFLTSMKYKLSNFLTGLPNFVLTCVSLFPDFLRRFLIITNQFIIRKLAESDDI